MNCSEARLRIGAEPYTEDTALGDHLRGCEGCRQFLREMRALDVDVRHVLERPVPAAAAAASHPRDSRSAPARAARAISARLIRPSRWALAASVVALAGAALLLWALQPTRTLADEVVAHVNGEPHSWSSTEQPTAAGVQAILEAAGVSLSDTREVIYARTCRFRGHDVPHLVVRTAEGPYTVMILPERSVHRLEHFNQGGYAGELVPAAGGTLAILGLQGQSAQLKRVAAEVSRAVHWRT